MSNSKKAVALATAVLVAPLALAACGSGEDQTDVVSEVATETNQVTAGAEVDPLADEKKEDDKDKPEGEGENADDPQAQGAPNPGAGVVNPFEDGTLPTPDIQPIENGQPASEADVRAMTDTMNRIYNPGDFVSWTRVIMDNSCKKVVDQTNQQLASQGTSLEKTEREMQLAVDAAKAQGRPIPPVPATQTSLSDVRVNGDTASANVTVNTNGQTESGVQRFARENGQWKVCN